jgi:hypothetical protein
MPARVLYAGQDCKIVTNGAISKFLPVQSAGVEVTIPNEDILTLGRLGSVGRFQTTVATCKADIKTYLAITGNSSSAVLTASVIQALTGEALAGSVSTISVTPNGFTMSGILASFGVDISNGSFATADLSFVGVGEPAQSAAPVSNVYSEPGNAPTSFTPVTSNLVSGQGVAGCANSIKFSLDLPNDTVSCLGGAISGGQVAVSSSFLMVAKPPFKASISVEGTAVDYPTGSQLTSQYQIGKFGITLPNGKIASRSVNQAVGNVGATYSYTVEDVSALFADL